MKTTLFTSRAASGLMLLTALAQSAVHSEASTPAPLSPPSIDGTYELTERVMANGTVLRPPSIVALYTMADGRFNLNLFVKNRDGNDRVRVDDRPLHVQREQVLRVDRLHDKKQS
jgi:hypothetical protein